MWQPRCDRHLSRESLTLPDMGNVIPWSQIHPTIKGQTPFVGVVLIDPERQLCVSELITLDNELLRTPDGAAGDVLAAAQQAATAVASAYRGHWRGDGSAPRLKVLKGAAAEDR